MLSDYNTEKNCYTLEIQACPFVMRYKINNKLILTLNENNYLNFHNHTNTSKETINAIPNSKIELTQETKHKHDNNITNLNQNLENLSLFDYNSFDLSFKSTSNIFGLPERMTDFNLKDTDSSNAYRLYNLDYFNKEGNNIQSLYGSIPLIHAISDDLKVITSFLFNNTTETWVDIKTIDDNERKEKLIELVSQGGAMDFYFLRF